jgi:hypothetical protein
LGRNSQWCQLKVLPQGNVDFPIDSRRAALSLIRCKCYWSSLRLVEEFWLKRWRVDGGCGSTNGISKWLSGIRKVEIWFLVCNHRCLTRLRFCLVEVLFGLMTCCFVWIMSIGLGQGRSLVSNHKEHVVSYSSINRGFDYGQTWDLAGMHR